MALFVDADFVGVADLEPAEVDAELELAAGIKLEIRFCGVAAPVDVAGFAAVVLAVAVLVVAALVVVAVLAAS